MKKILAIVLFLFAFVEVNAFETYFMSVDFNNMILRHNGEEYTLVEVKNKTRRMWREVTYLCIDQKLHAVAFRLFVTDEGEFLRLQKFTSRRK
jgi:uncharacterized protein YxeA